MIANPWDIKRWRFLNNPYSDQWRFPQWRESEHMCTFAPYLGAERIYELNNGQTVIARGKPSAESEPTP